MILNLRSFRILIIVVLVLVCLGGLRAFSTLPLARAAPAPLSNGPLVPTLPFTTDREDTGSDIAPNYARVLTYAWEVDPLLDEDSQYDYFMILVSATVQSGSGW